ncbi:MAG: tetratricopeptide repeat protein, partial [FCB group bacterium]|nr:tetratricopeptide repeat protein [FCB group bacterium]
EESNLTEEQKQIGRITLPSNLAFVAWARGDLETARTRIAEYRSSISEGNVGQVQTYHSLEGLVAFKAGDFDKAVTEFEQTSSQNPIFVYYLGEALIGQGSLEKGLDLIGQAVHFNSVNDMNYALIRAKATRRLKELQNAGT